MKTLKLVAALFGVMLCSAGFAQPTVTIGAPSVSLANSSTTVEFGITYAGASTVSLTADKVNINYSGTSGGSKSIVNGTTNNPTVRITGVLGNGSYTISVQAGSSSDGTNYDAGAGPSASVTVDNTAPTVSSIIRKTPASATTNASTLVYTVTFSESVTGIDISDFSLTTAGTAAGTITSVSSVGGTSVDVTITSVGGDGSIRLDLNSTSTGIVDVVGNSIDGGYTSGEGYTLDNIAPTVSSIVRKTPATATTNASTLVYTVTFSESVTGIDISDFSLTTAGTAAGTITSVSSAGGTSVDVTITSVGGDGTIRLDLNSTSTGIADAAGNSIGGGYTSGEGYTLDNIAPTVSSIVRKTPATATTNASTLVYTVTFSESVTGIDISDFSLTTTGTAAGVISSVSSGSGSSVDVTLTSVSGNGTIRLDLNSSSTGIADAAGNGIDGGYTVGQVYTMDNDVPTVSIGTPSVSIVSSATTVSFPITYTGATTVDLTDTDITINHSGTSGGTINVEDGATATPTVEISGVSGTGSYTISITAGSSYDDVPNYDAGAGPSAAVTVDNTAPTASVTYSPTGGYYKSGTNLTITATFNEAMKDSPKPQISLSGSPTTLALSDMVKTSSTVYTYTHTVPSGNGTQTVALGTGTDLAGNTVVSTPTGGSTFVIDNTAPTVTSVAVPANGTYALGENLEFTVNFNETVVVTGSPYLTIDLYSDDNKVVNYVSGSGTAALVFRYTVQTGDYDGNGIGVDNLIILSTGDAIADLAGNSATLTLNNIGNTSSVKVDARIPAVESVIVPSDGYYKLGQYLDFTVLYSKAVTVTGTPYIGITLNTGGLVKANYLSSSSTTTSLVFRYTIAAGNLDTDGIALASSIGLSGGTIKSGTTSADLTLTGLATSLTGVIVDAVPPAISSSTVPSGSYGIGSTIAITINADASNYTAADPTVNGEASPFINMGSNVYKVFYTVQSNSINHSGVTTLPASIILKDLAGNTTTISSLSVQGGTLSINTKPTVHITGSTTKCDYPWQTVPITFTFTGVKPYTFTYSDGTSNHTETDWNSDTYSINVVSGTYTLVSLTDQTGNVTTSALENATITINPVTTPTFSVSASPYNVTEGKDDLSKYVSPTGGTFWGTGVGTDGYFYPSVIDVSGGAVTCNIKYSYTNSNGCKDTVVYDVIVRNESVYFSGLSSYYCATSASVTDTITVEGLGTVTEENFDIPGTTQNTEWQTIENHKIVIDPKLFAAGSYSLTYTYKENDKTYTVTDNFDIVKTPTAIDFNALKSSYCGNDSEVLLIADNNYAESVKGHFSGPISGFSSAENSSLATFTPTAAPKDQNLTISYYFETKEGCLSPTITKPTRVNAVPEVSFTLRDNYNYDETPIALTGSPEGGSFYGEIIELSKTLKPSLISQAHLGQSIDITYSYTNTTTGCVGSSVVQTKVYKAEAPIENLSSVYCYSGISFDITCTPTLGSSFVFSSKKNALVQNDDHTATYSIASAGEGVDTVWYRYNINSTPYEIMKTVYIDSIGDIALDISSDFCNNDDPIIIVGQHREMNGANEYTYTGSTGAFQGNAIYATFSPEFESPGDYSINYKFTTEKGCYKEITKNISVNSVSSVAFQVTGTCPGINEDIQFVNNSTEPSATTITWEWSFEGNKVYEKNPTYSFTSAGLKTVTLRAVTDKGCDTDNSLNITIGYNASADFNWDRECFTSDSIQFTDNSSGGSVISSAWKYNEATLSTNRNFKYKFPDVGTYNLELVIETAENCKDSITKQITIQKFIDFSANKSYLDNFDNAAQDWVAKGLTDSDYSSWILGMPTGTYFNSAASGNSSWYTNTGLDNQIKESSQVLSPCFDLRGLQKPMVKLNIWSAPEEGRDGAVLQYSTDGGNTWLSTNVVGAEDEGINWYDPINIGSKPAGQSAGWSGANPQEGWKSARHNLEMLKDSSNVRFRIVYANEANNISSFNGFAFDDFWIGERQQTVLNEVFTNTDNACSEVNLFLKEYEKLKEKDVVSIHYHTANPADDPFYNYYSTGSMSRGFYYGVSSIPHVFSNGLNSTGLSTDAYVNEYKLTVDRKTLLDPVLTIDQLSGAQGRINVIITANENLSAKNLVLYCALVKDSIQGPDGKYFYNVLRNFYPNSSGILLPTSSWDAGQAKEQSIEISFGSSAEIIDAKLVLFIQDGGTNQVYQVATYSDLQIVLSTPSTDINQNVDIYPNPANEFVYVECASRISQLMVFDVAGRLIAAYAPEQEKYVLPVQNYKRGVYIIKGTTKNGQFVKKIVKQ